MYNIDLYLFARQLLPTFLRKTKIYALLQVIVSPIVTLYNEFLDFKLKSEKKVNYTSQVIYFEKTLNDLFDPTSRGIFLTDGIPIDEVFIGNSDEYDADPYYIGNADESDVDQVYIGNSEEYDTQFDFIVNIPISVYTDLGSLITYFTSIIDFYKLAGKQYYIQTY